MNNHRHPHLTTRHPVARRSRALGASIIEVMVALTVGLVLIAGALNLYVTSSRNYTVHETSDRLEEAARYAFAVMEPDIREAGFWGLVKGATSVTGGSSQASGTTASALGGTATGACGLNFEVDVQTTIEGTNDGYLAGAGSGCGAYSSAMPSADTLTVRHASVTPTSITGTGPLYICSNFAGATLVNVSSTCPTISIPNPAAPATPILGGLYDLVVNTYYVNEDSTKFTGLPTLFRQTLTNTSGKAPSIVNTEVLPGVEDLQVQFGIDPTGTTGIASQYLDAQTASQLYNGAKAATAQVVAVRIWLLMRSDTKETGFVDNNTYQYANRLATNGVATTLTTANAGKAYAPADGYRRLLVSRTIMLRNALGT